MFYSYFTWPALAQEPNHFLFVLAIEQVTGKDINSKRKIGKQQNY